VRRVNTKSDEHRLIGLGIGRDCGRAPYGAKPRRTDVRRPASEGPGTRPQVAIDGIWYKAPGSVARAPAFAGDAIVFLLASDQPLRHLTMRKGV
jgi:hypothetical protein